MLVWAPNGHYLVLAGLGTLGGMLDFFNVDLMESMGTADHMMATNLEWDPTGQFLATHVSAWRHKLENGYNIYTFRGDLVHKIMRGGLYQFLWRPRPPSLLTDEDRKEIKSNLSRLAKEFKKEEEDVLDIHARDDREKRENLLKQFREQMQRWQRWHDEERAERRELRGGHASDNDDDWEEVVDEIEEVLDEKVESI